MKLIKLSLTNFFSRLLFAVKVEGESAWPDLVSGKQYLATNLFKPRPGDFTVFKNPQNPSQIFVKRLAWEKEDKYWVEGNVSGATSSRTLGLIPESLVLGKIVRIKNHNHLAASLRPIEFF